MREVLRGGGHDRIPFAGQSAGLITDVRPAARIVQDTVHEAARILDRLATCAGCAAAADDSGRRGGSAAV